MTKLTLYWILAFLMSTFLIYPLVQGEVYTATEDIQKLIYSEYTLYNELDNYISEQQIRLSTLRNALDKIKLQMDKIHMKGYDQGKHPLAIFLLVKRFLKNWKDLKTNIEEERNANSKSILFSVPS